MSATATLEMKPRTPLPLDLSEWKPSDVDFKVAHAIKWLRENHPKEDMKYKEAHGEQVYFIWNKCAFHLFHDTLKVLSVISTHTSKSITLPVFHIALEDGTELILRDNFHGWNMTVLASKPLDLRTEFFEKDNYQYCEGFDKSWILPAYSPFNRQNFTVGIGGDYDLYTVLNDIRRELAVMKPDLELLQASVAAMIASAPKLEGAYDSQNSYPLTELRKLKRTIDLMANYEKEN